MLRLESYFDNNNELHFTVYVTGRRSLARLTRTFRALSKSGSQPILLNSISDVVGEDCDVDLYCIPVDRVPRHGSWLRWESSGGHDRIIARWELTRPHWEDQALLLKGMGRRPGRPCGQYLDTGEGAGDAFVEVDYAPECEATSIVIEPTPDDDPAFVELIRTVICSAATESTPYDVVIVQIDNWFGPKWLKFAGKLVGALGARSGGELIVPPFHPNRICGQHAYARTESGAHMPVERDALHIKQWSESNLRHKMSREAESGLFAWWSRNTARLDQGSLMVYVRTPDYSLAWFVSLRRKDDRWQVDKCSGISKETVELYAAGGCRRPGMMRPS